MSGGTIVLISGNQLITVYAVAVQCMIGPRSGCWTPSMTVHPHFKHSIVSLLVHVSLITDLQRSLRHAFHSVYTYSLKSSTFAELMSVHGCRAASSKRDKFTACL